jgi:hypothetical protein
MAEPSAAPTWDEQSLRCLSRRDLQRIAKSAGVRGNMRSADIISELLHALGGGTSLRRSVDENASPTVTDFCSANSKSAGTTPSLAPSTATPSVSPAPALASGRHPSSLSFELCFSYITLSILPLVCTQQRPQTAVSRRKWAARWERRSTTLVCHIFVAHNVASVA